jgi:hypothetical protein
VTLDKKKILEEIPGFVKFTLFFNQMACLLGQAEAEQLVD